MLRRSYEETAAVEFSLYGPPYGTDCRHCSGRSCRSSCRSRSGSGSGSGRRRGSVGSRSGRRSGGGRRHGSSGRG